MAWAWAPALKPFRLCSLLTLSSGGAVGARSERVPTPLRGAGSHLPSGVRRAWRRLGSRLKALPTCHVPPAPACPACPVVGRF